MQSVLVTWISDHVLAEMQLFYLLWFTQCFCSAFIQVDPSTRQLVDGEGRQRYFHGVNVVVKGPPWIPEASSFDPKSSFVEEDMRTLRNLGLNAIR